MGKLARTLAFGAALSIAAGSGVSCGEKSQYLSHDELVALDEVDLDKVPKPDVAIAKRDAAEQRIGKTCIAALAPYREEVTDTDATVRELLDLPDQPCGDTSDEVEDVIRIVAAHDAEVEFAEDLSS